MTCAQRSYTKASSSSCTVEKRTQNAYMAKAGTACPSRPMCANDQSKQRRARHHRVSPVWAGQGKAPSTLLAPGPSSSVTAVSCSNTRATAVHGAANYLQNPGLGWPGYILGMTFPGRVNEVRAGWPAATATSWKPMLGLTHLQRTWARS